MIIIDNSNKDPYLNHAIEEHLINTLDDDCFMLWQNAPCVLIGRNQNVYAEINMDYIHKHDILVVRRITGGGTVFNDDGNFNFTFIAKKKRNRFADFKTFTTPIVAALNSIGVNAEFSGRNDLLIEGKKFSGNAQCILKDKVLHHGTLLYSVDMNALTSALNVSNLKLQSKNVASAKSRVTNISEHLSKPMSLSDFKRWLLGYVYDNTKDSKYYELTSKDIGAAEEIANTKYRLDSWNFPQKIDFSMEKEKRFEGGIVQFMANINDGIIKTAGIYGDFFSEWDKEDIEKALIGIRYSRQSICDALGKFDTEKYFKNVTAEELLSLII